MLVLDNWIVNLIMQNSDGLESLRVAETST
jgi:hypothetical protein